MKPNYPVILPHQCRTAVSLKNYPLYSFQGVSEDSKRRCTVDGSANIAKIVFKQPQIMAKSFYK